MNQSTVPASPNKTGQKTSHAGKPSTPAEPQIVMETVVLDCEAQHELQTISNKLDEASKLALDYLDKHKCNRGREPGCSCPMCVQFPEMYRVVDAVETVVSIQRQLLDNLRPLTIAEYELTCGALVDEPAIAKAR